MIPFLLHPLALLGLVSIPVLAAIYIFRNRFRRRNVSSLMLWRFATQPRLGGARRHRLQLPLIFFVELLALILLVTAAAGPQWKSTFHSRPLIVILDDSVSMRAKPDTESVQQRARTFLEKLIQRQKPPSIRLIFAAKQPRIAGPPIRTQTELSEQLQQWQCLAPTAALDQAIGLAAELGRGHANVLVLTDHAPPEATNISPRLQWRAFGVPAKNLAIVNAARSTHGDQDRCLLEIYNGSSSTQQTRLVVFAGTNALRTSQMVLGPHELQRLMFDIPNSVQLLRAELQHDALSEDNVVQLLPPLRKRVRVGVALTNAILAEIVERALEATDLRVVASENPDLLIHQSPGLPSGDTTWSLRIVQPEAPVGYLGPFLVDTAHPVTQGLSLQGVVWAAQATTNRVGELPIITAGNVPLLSVYSDVLGRHHLTLNFEPSVSTLQNTPNWPILFWNILYWRATHLPGPQENNVRLGSELVINGTGEPVTVSYPDGTKKVFQAMPKQFSVETPIPGLYTVAVGQSTYTVAVNLLSREESDLSQCQTGTWGSWQEDHESHREETPLVWAVALAALTVMVLHMFLVATGKGGE